MIYVYYLQNDSKLVLIGLAINMIFVGSTGGPLDMRIRVMRILLMRLFKRFSQYSTYAIFPHKYSTYAIFLHE